VTSNQCDLTSKRCTACHVGAPKATQSQISDWLPEISNWSLVTEGEISRLSRGYAFANFVEAMKFANLVADLAESEGHHPLITVEWGSTLVQWWTHAIGGLHENDFIMAAKTDALLAE